MLQRLGNEAMLHDLERAKGNTGNSYAVVQDHRKSMTNICPRTALIDGTQLHKGSGNSSIKNNQQNNNTNFSSTFLQIVTSKRKKGKDKKFRSLYHHSTLRQLCLVLELEACWCENWFLKRSTVVWCRI